MGALSNLVLQGGLGILFERGTSSQFRDDEEYEVLIDSSLEDGYLTYGECVLPGRGRGGGVISSHVCHPSLANDNLSGIAVAVKLARILATRPRRYTYRFLFVPGTIGSITWLARNEGRLADVKHGVVLTCLGDVSDPTYKRSRVAMLRLTAHLFMFSSTPANRIL